MSIFCVDIYVIIPLITCPPGIYIVAAKRTPFGRMGGMLRDINPSDLVAIAAREAFKAGNVSPAIVDTVNIGQVNVVSSFFTLILAKASPQ